METLAIPVFHHDSIYTTVEIKEPSPGALADTRKEAETGAYYKAIHKFLAGSIASYHTDNGTVVDDPAKIAVITRYMPYVSADTLSLAVLADLNDDDLFEGVYHCPRCGHQIICELKGDDDTRDSLSDLPISIMDDPIATFPITLSAPVVIQKRQEVDEISTLEIAHPTLDHCIKAASKVPSSDKGRRQLRIYAEALVTVNEQPITDPWRNNWGMHIMLNASMKHDIKRIAHEVNKYGVDPRIDKVCPNCGKEYKAQVNTSNFFVSALQSDN